MSKYTLYGDEIHDDTDAIQEMIDSGVCEVSFCDLQVMRGVLSKNKKRKMSKTVMALTFFTSAELLSFQNS